jgi:hypothetical protein
VFKIWDIFSNGAIHVSQSSSHIKSDFDFKAVTLEVGSNLFGESNRMGFTITKFENDV